MIPTYVHALATRAFRRRHLSSVAESLRRFRQHPASEVELAALLDDDPVAQAELAAAVEYTPSHWLIEAELTEVDARRSAFNARGVAAIGEPYDRAFGSDLVGLCFSGGGNRSATFNLGVLQGLAEVNLLRRFDYLSSVSGGGWIHQWLAAWIRRESKADSGDAGPIAGVAAFTAVNDALRPAPGDGAFGISLGRTLAGQRAKTGPQTNGNDSSTGWATRERVETLAAVTPYVFLAGLLVLIAFAVAYVVEFADARRQWALVALLVISPIVAVVTGWRVDLRHRGSNTRGSPEPFAGFDERDASDDTRLAQFRPSKGYYGPYSIFCTAMNVIEGGDPAWQERKAASFIFTPLLSGYDSPQSGVQSTGPWMRYSGFVRTDTYAYPPDGIHVKTAAAISGAPMGPSAGDYTSPATAFLMTLFGVRLGWRLPDPRRVDEHGRVPHTDRHLSSTPHFALQQLANELFSRNNGTSKYVCLTDGRHFDNLGLYELVRRQCRHIVICDSQQDDDQGFAGLAMAIRKCRADFGVEISLDVRSLRRAADSPYSLRHVVAGTIKYPVGKDGAPREGVVLYVKSSLTGDEPGDVRSFQREHTHIPHDSTPNQTLRESPFDSYRRLGIHVIRAACAPASFLPADTTSTVDYFSALSKAWYPSL